MAGRAGAGAGEELEVGGEAGCWESRAGELAWRAGGGVVASAVTGIEEAVVWVETGADAVVEEVVGSSGRD